MFGKRCSLCGGKLNGQNICTECGLDNTKTDRNYKINQSSCDSQPLTHVHPHPHPEEKETKKKDKEKRKQTAYSQPKQNKSHGSKKWIALIPVFLILLSMIISILSALGEYTQEWGDSGIEEFTWIFEDDDNFEYEYDPYEYVTRELSEDGEAFHASLGQGNYVVGVHIPEGNYTISSDGEYVSVAVNDEENGIWLYENLDAEMSERDDIRLYKGARVEVAGDAKVTFSTENGQVAAMTSYENPLSETVVLSGEQAVAGTDFEPGTYDLSVENGYGSVDIIIYDEQENVVEEYYLWLDVDYPEEREYKNVVLPKGSVLSWDNEQEMKMTLTPSEWILSEDYISYYVQEGEY